MLAAISSGLDLNVATTGPTYLNTGPTPAADMPQIKDTMIKDSRFGHLSYTNPFERWISKNSKRHRRSDKAPYRGYLCSYHGQILTIFSNGTVGGTPFKTPFSSYATIVFEHIIIPSMLLSTFVPTKPIPSSNCNSTKIPLFQLKGEKNNAYVCMNSKGNLYSSRDPPDPSECKFIREHLENRYVTFKSCKYPEDRSTDYFIALRKDGKTYSGSNQKLTNSTSVHEVAWFLEKTLLEQDPRSNSLYNQVKSTQPPISTPPKKERKCCKDKIRHSKHCKKEKSRTTKKCRRLERRLERCKGRKTRCKGRNRDRKKKNRKRKNSKRRQRRTSTTTATVTKS